MKILSVAQIRIVTLVIIFSVLVSLGAAYSFAGEKDDTCPVPKFSFRWVSENVLQLNVIAKPEVNLKITVEAPQNGSWEKTTKIFDRENLYVPDKPEGVNFNLYLRGHDLLTLGGVARISYDILEPACCNDNKKKGHVEEVVVLPLDILSIDFGPSFELNADGTFNTKAEIALDAVSRWNSKLSGMVDVRLAHLGAVSKIDNAISQFKAGGSTLEGSAAVLWHPCGKKWNQPKFSVVVGMGFRTVPEGSGFKFVDARGKGFGGFRYQVLTYNPGLSAEELGGSRGFIELGYAKDRFWKDVPVDNSAKTSDQSNRFYAIGQIEVPGLTGKYARILLRGLADMSTNFKGPAEIRISMLASVSPSGLKAFFGGVSQ